MHWFNHPIFLAFLACLLIQLVAWFYQKQHQNADSVDIAWTLGIVVCVFIYWLQTPSTRNNQVMVLLFPFLWYLRLLVHLLVRYDVNHEDSRYQNLRSHWSEFTQTKFLLFFCFQGVLSVLFSLTAYWVLQAGIILSWQMITASSLGVIALLGVTLSDLQLLKFKRSHDSSQVCDVGLWQYSRHPNYFFEWLHWFVYPLLLWHSTYFWWSILIVVLMLLFLLKLTGIPFSEQQALKKRGEAYRQYQNRTSPFILWKPKHD
jgi:steroid 5-alpha reductase family enzyme